MIKIFYFSFLLLLINKLHAQDSSLLKMMDDTAGFKVRQTVSGTFKATQIVNTPTIEAPAKGALQFMIMHRFGKINDGAYNLFGLDNAEIRFGLDYGITDNFSIGIGRSSFDKVFDASLKLKLLKQQQNGFPVSVSLYSLLTHTTLRYTDKAYMNLTLRTSYTTQLLLAKKINRNLSLQLTPAWLHFNIVPTPNDDNNVFAVGVGGRLKLKKRLSINAEYSVVPKEQLVTEKMYNSLSMGVDLETGGHVFQLIFTNSRGMVGPYYLTKTNGTWDHGDIYFGFNITRNFTLRK